MGREGQGVEVRARSIRICFRLNGQRHRERLTINGQPLEPTPANIKYALRVAADLRKRIAAGVFDWQDFFPDSAHARAGNQQSFGAVADAWLAAKGQLAPATKAQYQNAVRMWKAMLGPATPMQDLSYQVLAAKIGGHPWPSGKHANNRLVALRGVMAFHYAGARATDNPMAGIKNLPVVRKLPDPLTPSERDRILADMANRYDPRVQAYFQFAFFTGMRPEEQIALRWDDIDWPHKTATVRRVRTFKGNERDGSKTHRQRDVRLTTPALDALNAMKPYTYMKKGYVFERPSTGKPWHDERSQREDYWDPCLLRLGIRARRAYATRHTYATAALMAGIKPAYIARQLGHATTQMLFEKYGRWIDSADQDAEGRALEAAFGSPKTAPQKREPPASH